MSSGISSHESPRRKNILAYVGKLIRYALVGVASVGVYAVVTALAISGGGFDGKLGSIIGYLTALPLNFLANRRYTFLSDGAARRQAIRFASVHAVSISVSVAAMAVVVDGLGLHYGIAILAAVILVPIATFVVMDAWVFGGKKD
jgi:putative flippase GtrA